jgi:hypothetical protein
MSPDFKSKVIADLEKTGFPSEFKVRNAVLSFSGKWTCTGALGFFDLDERKLRQIDICAFMPCGDRVSKKLHTHTVWQLIMEVKKSESGKPWVVFKEDNFLLKLAHWRSDLVTYCNLPVEWDSNFGWRIHENTFCREMNWLGYGIHESFKQPSETSRPYNAMVSVVKAAEHFHSQAVAGMKKQKAISSDITKNPTRVTFTRPVVVLDGELLTAEVDKNGKLVINEADMTPMCVGYKSSNYHRENYRVDVVRLSAIKQYLDFAEKQHDAIRKAILEFGGLSEFTEEEIYNGVEPKKKPKAPMKK